MSPSVEWGAAVLQESSYFYIFGYRPSNKTVVLARTNSVNSLKDFPSWSFYKNSATVGANFATGAPVTPTQENDLFIVATKAVPQFTVTKVTLSGVTRYVMVQGAGNFLGHDLLLRVSVPDPDGTSPLQWNSFNPTSPISNATTCMINMGTPETLPNDDPFDLAVTAGAAYHQMAHPQISDLAGGKLKVSYYAHETNYLEEPGGNHNITPRDWNGDTTCGGDVYDWFEPPRTHVVTATPHNIVTPHFGGRLRFADVDLKRLRPWCTGADRQCCRMPSGSTKNCHLGSAICCGACNAAAVGGVRQCGGPDCSDAGSSSQCCGGNITTANVPCTVGITNAPCVLNGNGSATMLCSQECYDAALGRPRCGGSNCGELPGGSSKCCGANITNSGKLCNGDALRAPCLLP